MNPLRHLLLVAVLLLAQLAAGTHAVGHAVDKESSLPAHTCELCLTAHDLGAALPALAPQPPVAPLLLVPEALHAHARSAIPAPAAPQRGPPAA